MKEINKARRMLCMTEEERLLQLFLLEKPEGLSIDHIIPRYHGGSLCIGNVQWLTVDRNNKKGCDYHWRHPYKPTCQPFGVHHLES